MLVTVAISDEIVREAQYRSLQVIDFVEMLIDKGLEKTLERPPDEDRPVLNNAIERIRSLSSTDQRH